MMIAAYSFLWSPLGIMGIVFASGSTLVMVWRYFQRPALTLAPGVPITGKPDDTSFEYAVREGDTTVGHSLALISK